MRSTVLTAIAIVGIGSGCATGSAPLSRGLAHENLNGVLWMQTSAEYEVLSRVTFNSAATALDPALRDPTWTAALEQTEDYAGKPPAVIVDIDETMLDNAPLQAQLALESSAYCPAIWNAWVQLGHARPLPGAVAFARTAAVKNVTVFYVTNRTAQEEAVTVQNLDAAGFPFADAAHVLMSGEAPAEGGPAWASDKTGRRAYLAGSHRILLLVGDDLRDFVSTDGAPTPEERAALARRYTTYWGTRWFLLPNALYGSWERALYDPKLADDDVLKAKRARLKGFRGPVAGPCPKPGP
jgi:acid phosphatase